MYVPKDAETRRWHEETTRKNVESHLQRIEKRLEGMAVNIRHYREQGHYIQPLHELMWGLANLNLDVLTENIADHERFAAFVAALDEEEEQPNGSGKPTRKNDHR